MSGLREGELIVDLFAGGGGASEAIRAATGRDPDYAINHDAVALGVHQANHPATRHLPQSVWQADPAEVVRDPESGRLRPVGLLWASPDCKHFSKAKGDRPVKRNIRDLAWVVVLWARRARPRLIFVENVEEFQDWGPVVPREDPSGAVRWFPCPERKGETFRKWVADLRRLGYRVAWREERACDHGAPTTRRRLFVIARRDGLPIVWPEPSHQPRDSEAVRAGRAQPWPSAASIIDWSIPCPSIFLSQEEAKALGLRVKRPLTGNTLARIARGVQRFVLENPRPFLVPVTHAGDRRVHDVGEPLRTITTANGGELALATPFLTKFRNGATGSDMQDPAPTVTANSFVKRPGGAAPIGLVAPLFVPRYGERPGQEPRCQSAEDPISTIVPTANGAQLVAAFMAQHNTDMVGHPMEAPVSTIVQKGCTQGLVAAHLLNLKGRDRRDRSLEEPGPAICAGGGHAAVVAAFLAKYFGAAQHGQGVDEPLHSVTTKPRFGLVTVTIAGEAWVLVDIGMRMLTPRELFLAQGFRPDYVIDRTADGTRISKAKSISLCGNSVSPAAWRMIRANLEAQAPRKAVTAGVKGAAA